MKNTESIIQLQQEIYGSQFEKYGDCPEGVFWNNTETQNLRFNQIINAIPKNHSSDNEIPLIHDIGCGTCAFHQYLLDIDYPHIYSGTEIVPEMITNARKKFPKIELFQRNIITESIKEQYDFVVLSGVLNMKANTSKTEWNTFVEQLLTNMYKMANCGIIFNFLTSHITVPAKEELHYINPSEILEFCHKNFSRFISLNQSYPLYEVTIAVYKPEYMKKLFSEDAFQKYF